ncbi:hypothetical protein K8R78_07020 [bacterium]|nr:hypothetical protein [bacterium]
MKYLTILLALLFVMPALADFVYICDDYEADIADMQVYVCDDTDYELDLEDATIFLTSYPTEAEGDSEIWYIVEHPYFADYSILLTEELVDADAWVYFMDWDD